MCDWSEERKYVSFLVVIFIDVSCRKIGGSELLSVKPGC